MNLGDLVDKEKVKKTENTDYYVKISDEMKGILSED